MARRKRVLEPNRVYHVYNRRTDRQRLFPSPQAYDALSYYERWVIALGQTLIQRGVLTSAELARKMREVESRG